MSLLLADTLACGTCHRARGPTGRWLPGQGLSGGLVFDEPAVCAAASNITPAKATGIGRRTDAQRARAIRDGLGRDGRRIGPPPNCGPPVQSVAHPSSAERLRDGEYLATLGHRRECHRRECHRTDCHRRDCHTEHATRRAAPAGR